MTVTKWVSACEDGGCKNKPKLKPQTKTPFSRFGWSENVSAAMALLGAKRKWDLF